MECFLLYRCIDVHQVTRVLGFGFGTDFCERRLIFGLIGTVRQEAKKGREKGS